MALLPFSGAPSKIKSVSNVDGTLTVSPTTGVVVASLNLANANTWSGKQQVTNYIVFDDTNFNTVVGNGAASRTNYNTVLGYQALQNTQAGNKIAIGHQSMGGTHGFTSSQDIGIGYQTVFNSTGGGSNVGIGSAALTANSSGSNNVAIGSNSLAAVTGGTDNIGIGVQSGNTAYLANSGVTTGSQNIFIGSNASFPNSTQLTNATAIGYLATVSLSNSLVLGGINGINAATSDVNVGINTNAPTNTLSLGGNKAQTLWMERTTTAATAGFALNIQAGGAVVGGTNLAGGDLILKTGVGTGNSRISKVDIQAPAQGTASGIADQSLVDRIILNGEIALTSGVAATILTPTVGAGQMAGGILIYTVEATNGTDMDIISAQIAWAIVNKAGIYTSNIYSYGGIQASSSAASISDTWAFSGNSLQLTSTLTGITATVYRITYMVVSNSQQPVTIP